MPTQALSQVINLMNNQKNCAVSNHYKGIGENILLNSTVISMGYKRLNTSLSRSLKSKKREQIHSTAACQAALCLHGQ